MEKIILDKTPVVGLVSVIVPVYNSGEKCLQRCLKSVFSQDYKKIEIIAVDDGSTDDSGKICDHYASMEQRIRVIHTQNGGPSTARNVGIDNAKGEFLFLIDSDDYIGKRAIKLLVEKYRQTKADLIVGDFEIKNHRVNSTGKKFLFANDELLAKDDIINYVRDYLKKPTGYAPFVYSWGKLFKLSIIKKNDICFDANLPVFEDTAFNFEYLKFTNSVAYVKDKIYSYCVNDNNLLSAGRKIYEYPLGYKLILKNIKDFLTINNVDANLVEKDIGNANVFFTIRTMIRFFAYSKGINLKQGYGLISNMINDSDVRQSLKFYSPSTGDSRIIPFLIKLKLAWLIAFVCKYKASRKTK